MSPLLMNSLFILYIKSQDKNNKNIYNLKVIDGRNKGILDNFTHR